MPTADQPESPSPQWVPNRARTLRIVAGYATISAAWILLSNWLVYHFVHDPAWMTWLRYGKGLSFVLVTSGLLYLLMRRNLASWRQQAEKREQAETGQIQAGEKLRLSEERLRLIAEASADGLWDCDLKTGTVEVNPRYWKIAGYPEERTQTNLAFIQHLIHPEDWPVVQRSFDEHISGQSVQCSVEYRITTQDGTVKWVWGRGKVVKRAPDGRPLRIVGTLSDITNRKRTEAAAREARQLYEFLFRGSPVAIILTTETEGRYLAANEAHERITGFRTDEIIGRSVHDFNVWEAPADRADVIRRMNEQGVAYNVEKVLRRKNGETYPALISMAPSVMNGQRCLLSIITDITEHKRAEAKLRESEERYRRLFEAESDAIILLDTETGRFVDANESALKLYGYSHEEFLGLKPSDISAEPEKSAQSIAIGETKVPLRWHRKRDGTVFPVEISGSYFNHSGRKHHVAAIRDIAERRWAEEILRRSALNNERLLACMVAIDACPDLDSALECLLRKSIELGGITGGAVYLIEGEEAVLQYQQGLPAEFVAQARRRPVAFGYVKTALEHPYEILNLAERFPEHHRQGEVFGLRHVYCVALAAGEKPFGYINLASQRAEPPTAADIELIRALALQTKSIFIRLGVEDRLRAILAALAEGVMAQLPDGSILECNQNAEIILGLNRDEILSRKLTDPRWRAIREDGRPFPSEEFPAMISLRTGQPCRGVTMGLHLPDGTRKWININAEPIFKSGNPRPVSVVTSFTDITERRQAEEKLNKLSLAVEQSPASVLITNLRGDIEYVNQRFCQTTGYAQEELLGKNPRVLKSGEMPAETYRHMWDTIKTGGTWGGELLNRKKDGSLFWEHAIISPVKNARGQTTHFLGIKEDVTTRKQDEETLRASREQLRTLAGRLQTVREEERTRVAREIHDVLAQDLTRLKMDIVWLSRRLAQPLDGARQKLLADKLTGMTDVTDNAIQSVQKIATELRPVVLDSLGLCAAVEWQARDFQEHSGIICDARISGEELTLDRERSTAVFRILQESLTNVIRHAAASRVEIRLHYASDAITLTVQDNGSGIPAARLDAPQSLGLLGMRERAMTLGGQFEITSGLAQGTIIRLQIPLPAKS